MSLHKKELIHDLHEIGAVKFGSFRLKSGLTSPFYIDLRAIISYPRVMDRIVRLLEEKVAESSFELITGIPYTALPVAAILADRLNKPLVYQRKEAKAYGTSKLIEGHFKKGDRCIVIDDVMTTGESKLETADALKQAGIEVSDFVIIVDRSFNGEEWMRNKGYTLHRILSVMDIVDELLESGKIGRQDKNNVVAFLSNPPEQKLPRFADMAAESSNPVTQRLLKKALEKKSNLVLSLDVDNMSGFFDMLEKVAGEIVMLKTHVDILKDFDTSFAKRLREAAARHNFLIFEDRKFADIGSTVRKQFTEGVYHIAEWADAVTVHALPGEGILQGLFRDTKQNAAAFLLAAMSAEGNLLDSTYGRKTIEMGVRNPGWVSGFIGFAQTPAELLKLRQLIPSHMLLLMPGVNMESSGDDLGQRYVSVDQAVAGGADFIIVGRGIIQAKDPAKTAASYREKAWQALKENGRI